MVEHFDQATPEVWAGIKMAKLGTVQSLARHHFLGLISTRHMAKVGLFTFSEIEVYSSYLPLEFKLR